VGSGRNKREYREDGKGGRSWGEGWTGREGGKGDLEGVGKVVEEKGRGGGGVGD